MRRSIIPFPTAPSKTKATSEEPRMLNVGCGRTYHADWINLDLESDDPQVLQHDVTRGIPFQDDHFDAVYHSHVLEHLNPEAGKKLIQDCFRVLKPGGYLRVVVPDLERIAELYLQMHSEAWAGDQQAGSHYQWIKLELLDQMVRESSGGRMGRYMSNPGIPNSEFVRSRVGDEFWVCQESQPLQDANHGWLNRLSDLFIRLRVRMARRAVRGLMGRTALTAFDEGLFRNRGEIHRWMYDRYSLRELCSQVGFESVRVCTASESEIEGFVDFELDIVDETVRKPDSLFIECRKPQVASTNRRAA